MAFQPVPDTAQCRFRIDGKPGTFVEGVNWYFSLYVRDEVVGWTQTNIDLLHAYCKAWWDAGKNGGAALKTRCVTSWACNEILVKDIGAENGLFKVGPPATPDGTGVGDPMAPQVAAIVQLYGDVGAVPKRGRIFWSGLGEVSFNGDNVITSDGTGLAARFTDFRADINDGTAGGQPDWAQVLVSRYSGTMPDPTPPRVAVRRAQAVTNTLGAAISVRPVVGSQRNRREGE